MNVFNIDQRIAHSKDLYLHMPSRELTRQEVLSDSFRTIVQYLLEALYENPIGVGLAAPQVGLMIQLAVIDIKRNGKNPLVLINPSYTPIGTETVDSTETCLSFLNRQGTVQRYKKVLVQAKDVYFNDIAVEKSDFQAIVCQHEIDHLHGLVYVDKCDTVCASQPFYEVSAARAMDALY